MTVFHLEKWWKRRDHRRIPGPRGGRFASLKVHGLIIFSVLALIEYVFRSTDEFRAMHFADPPVPAPPPMAKSLSYVVTSEMPHLKSLEVEDRLPAHLPQREVLDFQRLRSEGRLS